MNNKPNCNQTLPTNAVSVRALTPGMRVRFAFSGDGVHTVDRVIPGGGRVTIVTDKGRFPAQPHGTVRLVDAQGYNYHRGHGCPKDS